MMRCFQFRDHCERYFDGDVSSALRTKMEAHLTGCERCRSLLEDVTAMKGMFAAASLPVVPEDFFDGMMETLRTSADRHAGQPGKKWYLPEWWFTASPAVRIVYAVVLVVLVAAGSYMGRDLWKKNTVMSVATSNSDAYPGFNAFSDIPSGSVEQTYFKLISYGAERNER